MLILKSLFCLVLLYCLCKEIFVATLRDWMKTKFQNLGNVKFTWGNSMGLRLFGHRMLTSFADNFERSSEK